MRERIRKKMEREKEKDKEKDNLCGFISPLLNDESQELEMYINGLTADQLD